MNLPPRKEDQSYTYSLRAGGIIPPTRHKNPPIYTSVHDNVHLRIEVRLRPKGGKHFHNVRLDLAT
jgi:hypothetical protein